MSQKLLVRERAPTRSCRLEIFLKWVEGNNKNRHQSRFNLENGVETYTNTKFSRPIKISKFTSITWYQILLVYKYSGKFKENCSQIFEMISHFLVTRTVLTECKMLCMKRLIN